jgi:ActR/RegA family two-component response regulator
MQIMTGFYKEAIVLFKNKVNLLVIDDDSKTRASLKDLFNSPLFTISTAANLDESFAIIGSSPEKWHCWIVDIDLAKGQSGLQLLKCFPNFPYAVVLSGLRSMALAGDAIKLGARSVVDKAPAHINRLIDDVCKTAALGYVLRGKPTPQLDVFLLLQDDSVTSIEIWADRLNMPVRHLYRICEVHPPLTPHYALALYRSIYFLLRYAPGEQPEKQKDPSLFSDPLQQKLYDSSIEYIIRKHNNR